MSGLTTPIVVSDSSEVNPDNCKIYDTQIWAIETFVHSYPLGFIYLINKVLQFVSLFAQNSGEFCGLIVLNNNQMKKTARMFDQTIYDELEFDNFIKGNPIEFNLHLQGISKDK